MNQNELRSQVAAVCKQWSDIAQELSAVSDELSALSSDIESASDEIAGLYGEKRDAPRQEKQYYRELIDQAKSRKSELKDRIRSKKSELSSLRQQRVNALREGSKLRSSLANEIANLTRQHSHIGRNTLPSWAVHSIAGMRNTIASGQRFCNEQLRLLSDSFETKNKLIADDLEITDEEPSYWSILGPTPSQDPLHLVEPPTQERYVTQDNSTSVSTETYTVFDTLGIVGQTIEKMGVMHTEALLRSQGRTLVIEIGGKGMPDMLSLDQDNRLWITEIKATQNSNDIYQSGLLRTLKKEDAHGNLGREKARVLELSAEWLGWKDRNVLMARPSLVLRAISAAINKEGDPARKESLRLLSSQFREAARQGFHPQVCRKELVQVGMQADSNTLKPLQVMQSKLIDDFCKEVQPDRIVQVNILQGSANSEMFVDHSSGK